MKILIIITKAEVGGAQMSVLNLARELKNRGEEMTVAFGDGDFLPAELDKAGISYYRFQYLKRTHNPLNNLFFIWEIKKFLKKNNFSAAHFNSSNALFGAIGAKLADKKIRTVFTFRGMSLLDENYQPGWKIIYIWLFKILLLFVDAPVFVSRENLEKGRKITKRGRLIYNGLDPEKIIFLNKETARAELSNLAKINLGDKYIIGSIGRLHYQKNYEFLINNFDEILKIKSNAVLIIIGGGGEEEYYEKLIKTKRLEEKVFLLGNINNASRYIKGFDLFVLPSRYEGLSVVLIESLFAGVPMLVSGVGGNAETVGSENELYRLDDLSDFLGKFKKLSEVSVLGEVLAANQEKIKQFLINRTASQYEDVYRHGNRQH